MSPILNAVVASGGPFVAVFVDGSRCMLEKEISRRNFVRFSVVGAGAAAVAMSADSYEAAAETTEAGADYPNQIKIAHLSRALLLPEAVRELR